MSTPDQEVIFSIIVEMRSFQVVGRQDGPGLWRASISERTGGVYNTQNLGSIETSEGLEAALHLAFRHILRATGAIRAPEPGPKRPTTPSEQAATPWRLLG